ncbi:hypothetical protein [Treponema sp. C6A8]|uniref:hypothetical protein n=1 Tax=Treponema sp. C6A8 TaxID=1410609 RepID=UPI000489068F|nr:hypothetical protein [Treponema sp. C6A8]
MKGLYSLALIFVIISGLLQYNNKSFVILTNYESQSRTSYIIDKKSSSRNAWKKLKKHNGKYVTAEVEILKSSSPFSHTAKIITIEELQQ